MDFEQSVDVVRRNLPVPRRVDVPIVTALVALLITFAPNAFAETWPRVTAAEGTVVAHKMGEEARFVDMPDWRGVDLNQDLLAGDTLRTNAAGSLSIRFADKTLVRMGRNTTLLVKKIDSVDESVLGLQEGQVWARAVRGGSQLKIDTPAATAAIRGTDWTLRVSGDQTTLTVLEGTVELANSKGSVLVSQGEGATVTIGQAPRKFTLVNLKEREQLLLYSELRGVFSSLQPGALSGPRSRAERRRILAVEPAARKADDWLTLAETSLSLTGRAEARKALAHLKRPLGRRDEARAKLVEAMLAGQEMDYAGAVSLFAAALPGLPHRQKAAAAYGLWFARSLAEPNRSIPPPREGTYADDPLSALARAEAVAHLNGPAEAIALLVKAEKRFPNDARLPAMRAGLAFQLDRRDEVKAALERARMLDPDEPSYLLISARFSATVSSNLDSALADLQHAAAVAPGDDNIWNEIGLVQDDRDAIVEADAAYRRAVSLNPENPALHANYARFLMDNDQIAASKREIDAGEAIDPHSYAVLAAKGRYLLRIGKSAEAEKALLDASAINPTYGDALIGLAIVSYQQNAGDETLQALDNADRFDRDNPSIPLIRSGIALDQFQADDAILNAREALRRRQLRGGYYSGYDTNRQASSFLGITLENLGMDEWGQYYAARAYDPFKSSTYFDEDNAGRLYPFVGLPPSGLDRFPSGFSAVASELQGLLLDPLAVASEVRGKSLEDRSFFEATVTGSVIDQGAGPNLGGNIQLQGTSYTGLPVSYSIQAETSPLKGVRDNDAYDLAGANVQLGIRPSLIDNVFVFATKDSQDQGLPGQMSSPTPFDSVQSDNSSIGGAWSHTIEDRNVVQVFAMTSKDDAKDHFLLSQNLAGDMTDTLYEQKSSTRYSVFGINHMLGIGPVTVRYGAEALQYDDKVSLMGTELDTGVITNTGPFKHDTFATRSYLDATFDATRDLQFQAGAYLVRFDGESGKWGPIDPRLGVAWSPLEGQWLRAYYRRDTMFPTNYTLSPISTVGLMPMELGIDWGGQTQTAALRWDAEWTDRLFTSVEYQHVKFNGLSLPIEDFFGNFITTDGEIDRLNFSGNYWFGNGLGSFGSLTLNRSRDLTPGWNDDLAVPLIPNYVAQVGLKYVHPSRITAMIAQNFVGKRIGLQNTDGLPPQTLSLRRYTTTDAALTWTSENRSVDIGLAVTNIFDHRVQSAVNIPAPGRTITATLTSRF